MGKLQLTAVLASGVWLSAACLGCGAPDDGRKPFSGTVTWNGQPLATGTLALYSEKGATDSAPIRNGQFTIRSSLGPKTVSVTAEKELGTPPATERMPNPKPVLHQYLPKDCNLESKLKETLTAETKALTIALTGTEVPPPKDALKAPPE